MVEGPDGAGGDRGRRPSKSGPKTALNRGAKIGSCGGAYVVSVATLNV